MSSYLLFACTDFAQGILTLKLVIKVFKHYLNKRPRMALLSLYSLMSFVCKRIIFVVKSWGYFAITIHTKSIKFPPDEPKQAEADHVAIANKSYHPQMFRSKTIAASQCISNGGDTR